MKNRYLWLVALALLPAAFWTWMLYVFVPIMNVWLLVLVFVVMFVILIIACGGLFLS